MFFVGKPLGESDLIEFYFIIFRATVWKIIEFLSGFFVAGKFKQIAKKKLGLEGKKSVELSMYSH